jgi:5'-nucleotidase
MRRLLAGPVLAGLLLAPAACGSSDSDSTAPTPGSTAAASGTVILVTDDDGVAAPGIDVLVNRLRSLPNVSVQVVAPARNQSGTGGRTTSGAVRHEPATTASGVPATAVEGYPADTIRVALDDLKLRPALVVSGINKGQNVGPIAGISGTVGAARAAAQRGIPAIAVSMGTPRSGEYDYSVGADYVLREVQKDLPGSGATPGTATIANLNVPSCDTGQVRGLQELPAETKPDPRALEASNCTSTAPPSTEIASFLNGFAVLTRIPARD